jgi:cytochrome c biogenesis protein CcdA
VNAYSYLTLGISLIFLVAGILILSGAYNTGGLFTGNEHLRWIFGSILILYGIFRGVNAYFKLKNKNRNFRYYHRDEDDLIG